MAPEPKKGFPWGTNGRVECLDWPSFSLPRTLLHQLGPALPALASQVACHGPIGSGAVVLLTGTQRGTGVSTLALLLASASVGERSVVLVDGDLVRGGLSSKLPGHSRRPGWEQVSGGTTARPPVLLSVEKKRRFPFWPLQPQECHPETLLAGPEMEPLLEEMRQVFDLVLIDGGPLEEYGARWGKWADATLLVHDPARDWAGAWDRLEEEGGHVLGVVETFV